MMARVASARRPHVNGRPGTATRQAAGAAREPYSRRPATSTSLRTGTPRRCGRSPTRSTSTPTRCRRSTSTWPTCRPPSRRSARRFRTRRSWAAIPDPRDHDLDGVRERVAVDRGRGRGRAGTAGVRLRRRAAAARFWDEGLAGHIAASSGDPRTTPRPTPMPASCCTTARCRRWPSWLPSQPAESALTSTAATAFAGRHRRYGLPATIGCSTRPGRATAAPSTPSTRCRWPSPTGLAPAPRSDGRRRPARPLADAPAADPDRRPYWRSGLAVLGCSLVGIGFSLAMPLSFRPDRQHPGSAPAQPGGAVRRAEAHDLQRTGADRRPDPAVDVPGLPVRAERRRAARDDPAAGLVGESFAFDLGSGWSASWSACPAAYFARHAVGHHRARGPRRRGGAGSPHAGGGADGLGGGRDRLLRGAAVCAGAEARGDHADRAARSWH